jgi:hypothetical protein
MKRSSDWPGLTPRAVFIGHKLFKPVSAAEASGTTRQQVAPACGDRTGANPKVCEQAHALGRNEIVELFSTRIQAEKYSWIIFRNCSHKFSQLVKCPGPI